jgi:hypothetical protein
MKHETHWVCYRTFFCNQQGRHPKHLDKLLDEGTVLFLGENTGNRSKFAS